MTTAAIAILIKHERDLVEHFIMQRATSVATAQTLQTLGVEHDRTFRRLEDRAVIRSGVPGTYYLDEPTWNSKVSMRRRVLVVVLLIGAILIGYFYTTSQKRNAATATSTVQSTD